MRKVATLLLFWVFFSVYTQEDKTIETLESTNEKEVKDEFLKKEYHKTTDFQTERKINDDLNSKYNFKYQKEKEKEKEKEEEEPLKEEVHTDYSGVKDFIHFLGNIFPYILGIIVILIIIKASFGSDVNFWNFGKKKQKEVLINEEEIENIEEANFEKLIDKAINNKNYRLATRYYYLFALQKLTQKEFIDYHKDKTNSDYLFELKDKNLRTEFSQISYIYDYAWYGEFDVDANKFTDIKTIFNHFIKSV